MTATREAIVEALLAKLTAAWPWGEIGRRNRDPNNIATPGAPALLLVRHHENY